MKYVLLDDKSHFLGFSSKRRVIGIDKVKCGGWRYPAWTETQRAHISFTHSATINGPHPSIFKPTQAPTSIAPVANGSFGGGAPFRCHFYRLHLVVILAERLRFFSGFFVPVVFAASCASNRSQIWHFSVFFWGLNWRFFCLRLFLLLVCLLFVCVGSF